MQLLKLERMLDKHISNVSSAKSILTQTLSTLEYVPTIPDQVGLQANTVKDTLAYVSTSIKDINSRVERVKLLLDDIQHLPSIQSVARDYEAKQINAAILWAKSMDQEKQTSVPTEVGMEAHATKIDVNVLMQLAEEFQRASRRHSITTEPVNKEVKASNNVINHEPSPRRTPRKQLNVPNTPQKTTASRTAVTTVKRKPKKVNFESGKRARKSK